MKTYLLKIVVIIITLFLIYISAPFFGYIFDVFFPEQLDSGFAALSDTAIFFLRGMSLSAILLLSIIFRAYIFKSNWIPLIILIPLFLWEFTIDALHIYFPIILGLIGWLIGYGIQKLISRSKAAG